MQNVFITFTKISLVFVTALLVTKHVNSQQLTSSDDLGKPQLTSSEDSGKLPMTSSDDSPINSVEENTSIFDLRLGNNDNNITEDTDARKSEHLLRIVNGDAVNLGHLPFMVRLLMFRTGGMFVCGGSILSEHWVLTAAHCVSEEMQIGGANYTFVMDGDRILVKAGDVSVEVREHSQEDRFVSQVYLHPKYHPWYLKADIALLYIEDGFYFDQYNHDNIATVEIATELPETGTSVTVAGWGLKADGELARTLQKNSYSVPDQDACNIHYANLGYHLSEGMWCTGDYDMTSHSAQGDSGGPVFINNEGSFTQYGLVSWGLDIEEIGSHDFDVNSDVAFYKTWIEKTLESYEESRHEVLVSETPKTGSVTMAGLGYFQIKMTCDPGHFIKVTFDTLSLSGDMSHVLIRDGDQYDSKLLLQRHGQWETQDIGVTSSSNKLLLIIKTSRSAFIKTVKFTFQAVRSRGNNSDTCGDSMTLCQNGLLCYDPKYKCDNNQITDCLDASDEEGCPSREESENGANSGESGYHKAASWVVVLAGVSFGVVWQ